MDRLAVAAALREIALLLALQGGQRFRARAYRRGAEALEGLRDDFAALVREGTLEEVPGIGAALAGVITDLARRGESQVLLRLRASLPAGVLDLHDVPHLTLRRMQALERELGITTRRDLEAACLAHRVRGVKGFGAKLEQRILDGLRALVARRPTLLVHEAEREGDALLAFVRALPGVQRAEPAGALRRRSDTVDEVVLVVATDDAAGVLDAAAGHPASVRVHERSPRECAFELADGVRVRVAAGPRARFADLWVRHTGSAAHVARLHDVARARGLHWSADGLASGGGEVLAADGEADVYRHLGLPEIPPELREGLGEVEAARCGRLPAQLVRVEDIRGAVHCHTVYSDGRNTIEEMARAAEAAGMEYLTITDHSASAVYAGGLTVDRLRAQWDEIAEVQARVNVTLLRGTECDILADGALDFPDDVLEQLDVVIASIHQRHKLAPEEMTRRIVAAMRHPCFKIWGHPLGRYVRGRAPIACDMRAVLDAAAESHVALEVNGDPNRLDAEARWQQEARARGIPLVISTDAHSVRGLANLRFARILRHLGLPTEPPMLAPARPPPAAALPFR